MQQHESEAVSGKRGIMGFGLLIHCHAPGLMWFVHGLRVSHGRVCPSHPAGLTFSLLKCIYIATDTHSPTAHRRTCTGASCTRRGIFREPSDPNPNIVNWGQVRFLLRFLSFLSCRLLVILRRERRALPWGKSTAGCRYVTYVWLIARINRYFKSQPFLIS